MRTLNDIKAQNKATFSLDFPLEAVVVIDKHVAHVLEVGREGNEGLVLDVAPHN